MFTVKTPMPSKKFEAWRDRSESGRHGRVLGGRSLLAMAYRGVLARSSLQLSTLSFQTPLQTES